MSAERPARIWVLLTDKAPEKPPLAALLAVFLTTPPAARKPFPAILVWFQKQDATLSYLICHNQDSNTAMP